MRVAAPFPFVPCWAPPEAPVVFLKRFMCDTSGATAMEYGLICAAIALVIIGALTTLSGVIWNKMSLIANATH